MITDFNGKITERGRRYLQLADKENNTPLHLAAEQGRDDIVEVSVSVVLCILYTVRSTAHSTVRRMCYALQYYTEIYKT